MFSWKLAAFRCFKHCVTGLGHKAARAIGQPLASSHPSETPKQISSRVNTGPPLPETTGSPMNMRAWFVSGFRPSGTCLQSGRSDFRLSRRAGLVSGCKQKIGKVALLKVLKLRNTCDCVADCLPWSNSVVPFKRRRNGSKNVDVCQQTTWIGVKVTCSANTRCKVWEPSSGCCLCIRHF